MIQIALIIFTSTDLLVDFLSYLSVTLSLFFDEGEHIKLRKTLVSFELFNDQALLFVRIFTATWSDEKNSGFNIRAKLFESLLKDLLAINFFHVGRYCQVRHEFFSILIVLADTL